MYTKFKPWKQTKCPQAAGSRNATSASSCDQVGTNRETWTPPALQFINSAHPSDAVSTRVIGAIRSHAAKEVHATRRRFKRQGPKGPLLQGQAQGRRVAACSRSMDSRPASCAAKLDAQGVASHRPGPRNIDTRISNTAIWLVSAQRNPFHRLARPLNDFECFLIDYYKTVIIPQTFSNVNDEASRMLYLWVPFVLSDSGLLSAIMLITCQCLLLLETHIDVGSPYAIMVVEYKGACIRSIMGALSQEGTVVSDFTIAKVMVLCSYELKFGDDNNARCHASAIGKMIELKGGLHKICPQDPMNQMIVRFWSSLAMTTGRNGSPIIDASTTIAH